MDRQSLERGIIRYGTPSYFFDMDLLTENFQAFREILGARAGLCFAMKANPFLAEQMAEMADRLEVCSPGEFKICRELQIMPEKLFLSGVLKKREEVYENAGIHKREERIYRGIPSAVSVSGRLVRGEPADGSGVSAPYQRQSIWYGLADSSEYCGTAERMSLCTNQGDPLFLRNAEKKGRRRSGRRSLIWTGAAGNWRKSMDSR